jgi:hypothetical protein
MWESGFTQSLSFILMGTPKEDRQEVEYSSRFFDAGKLKPRKHVISGGMFRLSSCMTEKAR